MKATFGNVLEYEYDYFPSYMKASCSLADIYQCFNDLDFSYTQACEWVSVTVSAKAWLTTAWWGG